MLTPGTAAAPSVPMAHRWTRCRWRACRWQESGRGAPASTRSGSGCPCTRGTAGAGGRGGGWVVKHGDARPAAKQPARPAEAQLVVLMETKIVLLLQITVMLIQIQI